MQAVSKFKDLKRQFIGPTNISGTRGRGMWALDANTVNNKSARRRFNFED